MMKQAQLETLTPQRIVDFLDKYIIGQNQAKKQIAIALRNRWRRMQVSEDLQEEIVPKNIIMIGATGVGKTEIARRIAKLLQAPFVKVEASKFTEVGYVGRDVESMVRDLVEVSINLLRDKKREDVKPQASKIAEQRILAALVPEQNINDMSIEERQSYQSLRNTFAKRLENKELEDKEIEINIKKDTNMPHIELFPMGQDNMDFNIKDMLGQILPSKVAKQNVSVKKAREIFVKEESEKLIETQDLYQEAIATAEITGIIFLDEIDKIANKSQNGGDVSREGVQRDLLPIVEGSTVHTKYGLVKTDHMLFIAAGAFHISKPSDLIPELQGRFPIRVELEALQKEEFVRILQEPANSLLRQYEALLETEQVKLEFTSEAIAEIAEIAFRANESMENIGARRLHAVLEKLLEELSFTASDIASQTVSITQTYVQDKLSKIIEDQDLSRYIL